jgi:hypothetical protein
VTANHGLGVSVFDTQYQPPEMGRKPVNRK